MFPVMKEAHKINGYLFVAMLTVMALYSLPKIADYVKKDIDALVLFFDGQLARDFEQDYDKALFLRETSVEGWANFRYFLFNEGLDGVVIGKNEWLFTKEEFGDLQLASQFIPSLVEQIKEVEKKLEANGKRLVMLPVPMKADIYSEFTPYFVSEPSVDIYQLFVDQLSKENVAHSPIKNAFLTNKETTQLFLKKDTHWTPEGAQLAAETFAADFPMLSGETSYATEALSEGAFSGDLLNFVKVSDWVAPELIQPEMLTKLQTVKSDSDEDQAADLFGDQSVNLALVGTSYTAIDDWNFPGYMRQALQQDLVSVAVKEKGPLVAMDQFMANDLMNDPDIEWVIWEFPVRSLIQKNNDKNSWQAMMNTVF
jgi:alginate O-acetyltransferase complex protein AlgJ